MDKTKDLTIGAMGCGISVLFLMIAAYIPTGKIAMGFIAAFIPCIMTIECKSPITSLISGISSALISAIILPKSGLSGIIIVLYCICFCYYPWLKSIIERKNNLLVEWIYKEIYFLAISIFIKFITTQLRLDFYNIILSCIILTFYDLLLTYVIGYYIRKISPKLKKSR